jgi:hypothetical protein
MTSTQLTYSPAKKMHSYTEYQGPTSPRWLDAINSQKSYQRINSDYYDGLRRRLQMKQEEAWEKVRRQEEGIENRNARSLMNFNRISMKSGMMGSNYRGAY